MNVTTRGKLTFEHKSCMGCPKPYKQKERIIRTFLTGTHKMTQGLECLQIIIFKVSVLITLITTIHFSQR